MDIQAIITAVVALIVAPLVKAVHGMNNRLVVLEVRREADDKSRTETAVSLSSISTDVKAIREQIPEMRAEIRHHGAVIEEFRQGLK